MSASRPIHLLAVEDEPVNRALVRAVLESSMAAELGAIELREATTLTEAREALHRTTPEVLLLDIRLPDGSGLDLMSELATANSGSRPFVVIMSASVLAAEREVAMQAGGDAFLSKPFRPSELIATLENAIRHVRARGSVPVR